MSYTDTVRFFYKGNRERAAQHVGTARRLLFELARQIGDAGLSVGRRRLVLPNDGTIIDVRISGLQAVAVIEAPPIRKEVEGRGDFVVWARDDAFPDGIDPEFPQQLLKPLGEAAENGWRAYKKSASISAGNGPGVYGGVFPDGLTRAGNIDWHGPNDERLSWYGPETRYWMDRFRQPSDTYGKFVFALGKALLDIDAYCLENEIDMGSRLVLGAALDGTSLLVMQAKIDDEEFPSLVPLGQAGDTFVSYAYPQSVVELRLYRYALTAQSSGGLVPDYNVAAGSHELLWGGDGPWLVNPWFFSPDGKKLETFSMPDAHLGRVFRNASDVFEFTAPSPWSGHFTLNIDDDAVTLESAEIAMEVNSTGASAPIAADYDQEGNRVELLLGYEFTSPRRTVWIGSTLDPNSGNLRFFLQRGEQQITLYGFSEPASGASVYEWRWPLCLDLRVNAWAFTRLQWTSDGHIISQWLETRHGELVYENDRIDNEYFNGGPPPTAMFHDVLVWAGAATVSPLFFLTGSLTFGFDGENPNEYYDEGQTWFDSRGSYHTSAFGLSWAQRVPDEVHGASVTYRWEDAGITGFELRDFLPAWANAPTDTDGYQHSYGFAADSEVVLFSGYVGMNKPGLEEDTEYHLGDFITNGALPTITGIDGGHNRYHPIWIAGKPLDIPSTGDAS